VNSVGFFVIAIYNVCIVMLTVNEPFSAQFDLPKVDIIIINIIIIIIINEYYYGGAVALLLQDHLTMSLSCFTD